MRQLRGVVATRCGYANGHTDNPSYKEVYTDLTGFAEVVEVTFDEDIITIEHLLRLFFLSIDPLSLNRQGEDEGTRYRTGIYYTDKALLPSIQSFYNQVAASYSAPLAVELKPLENFFSAEEYHQDYLIKNPRGYCHISPSLIRKAREW